MIDNAHEPGTAGTNKSEEGAYQGPAAEKQDEAYRAACAAARQLGEALIDEAVERCGRYELDDGLERIWDSEDVEGYLDLVAWYRHGETLDTLIRSIMAENGLSVPDDHGWPPSPLSHEESNIFFALLDAACLRLASIRKASVMTVSEAIADTAAFVRYARANARTTWLYARIGECRDTADLDKLQIFAEWYDKKLLRRLESLGLIVNREGRSVYPSTLSERDEARTNLFLAMRKRAYARASGYVHPMYGWAELRTVELSADEELELARIAAEISAETG